MWIVDEFVINGGNVATVHTSVLDHVEDEEDQLQQTQREYAEGNGDATIFVQISMLHTTTFGSRNGDQGGVCDQSGHQRMFIGQISCIQLCALGRRFWVDIWRQILLKRADPCGKGRLHSYHSDEFVK